jgi:hypothetical protein
LRGELFFEHGVSFGRTHILHLLCSSAFHSAKYIEDSGIYVRARETLDGTFQPDFNMAANKMAGVSVDPSKEEQIYLEEVAAVKKWWTDSRWRHTKRPFTAEQIVAKRGNLKIDYPSNVQSKKLWNILEGRFKVCSLLRNESWTTTNDRSEW